MENLNLGSTIILLALALSLIILIIFLLIFGLVSRKRVNKKIPAAGVVFIMIFSVLTTALAVLTPLTYYNYVDLNLRFGKFYAVNDHTEYYHFHRDSVSFYQGGGGARSKGTWELKNDILIIVFEDSSSFKYTVKGLGTELFLNGQIKYLYGMGGE